MGTSSEEGRSAARDSESAGLARIPRDDQDDFGAEIVTQRRALAERAAGCPLPQLAGRPVPAQQARGKIENLIGFAQVPVGLAGPLQVDTAQGEREVYVPMATTEGALVASYSRGMRLLNAGGGARARVVAEGLTQNPILVYGSARLAARAGDWVRENRSRFERIVAGTTRHGELIEVAPQLLGRRLLVRFVFTTGDAIGINMAARATELCVAEIARETAAQEHYVHGQDVEKRANARALIEGRGRSVIAEATLPRAALASLMRVEPEQLVAILSSYRVGFSQLGTQNWLVQVANGLAAVYLACGQDVAYVAESAVGILDFDLTPEGDLYASCFLPSLLVGTVGGGSGQGTALECLAILGCQGAGKAGQLAEILAATVLAGDLSLMAAFCSQEFVDAHERLGRNRPQGEA